MITLRLQCIRQQAIPSSLLVSLPDERSGNVQPIAQVFVYIIRNNTLSLRQGVSTALIRIVGIYYTQQSPFSELFDNNLAHKRGFLNLSAYVCFFV